MALFDVDADAVEKAAAEVAGETLALSGDVSRSGDVARAVAEVERAWGRLDVVICPGYVPTGIERNTEERGTDDLGVPVETPEGPRPLKDSPGTPEQVAALVAFLASDEAGHVTGTPVWIDGGETLVLG